ncbi:MAG: hypothetical protein IT352_17240 [Gemmatimonadales bacterium]|nr:hypothetical protein [Gemmatimonadales bacterium]
MTHPTGSPENPGRFIIQPEIRRAIGEVEKERSRPLLCYVANVINPPRGGLTGINARDHLPFNEMVDSVPKSEQVVDLLVATPGGSAETVGRFVDALRPRFRDVTAIVPYQAFSAGTLWVLAANQIIMDSRAVLGPIDPQVPTTDGRYVPAQALYALVDEIQAKVAAASIAKQALPLAWLEILRTIDKKELGAAITSSNYAVKMATDWIMEHKFRDWAVHSTTGQPVTDADKQERARKIAATLSNHGHWLSHAHGVRREDLRDKNLLGLKIDNLEDSPGVHRAVRRLWGVFAWFFDKAPVFKVMVADDFFWMLQGQPVK